MKADRLKIMVSASLVAAFLLLLSACGTGQGNGTVPQPVPTRSATATPVPTEPPAPTPTPTATTPAATAEPTAAPTATPIPAVGPDTFPEAVNPLTGLPVDDPALLDRPPLLIKVSNESNEVRPQSGMSFADHVWLYHMEGWAQTRFTAVYYSQGPDFVGSVRSVRLIDTDHLIHMYDALLVHSGSSIGLGTIIKYADWNDRVFRQGGPHLERIPDIPREGMFGYHSLFARPHEVWSAARERGVYEAPTLSGLAFSPQPAQGGVATDQITVDFPGDGPAVRWRYDTEAGTWRQWQFMRGAEADGFTPDEDYITGEQLTFENVVVIYADYYLADFIEDEPNQLLSIGPILEGEGEAVLLRDGQRFDLTWRRDPDDPTDFIRFTDENGDVLPFKPGQTIFTVITYPGFEYAPTVDYE